MSIKHVRPALPAVAAALALALSLGACAGPAEDSESGTDDNTSAVDTPSETESPDDASPSEEPSEPTEPAEPAEPEGPLVEITVEGDRISPNAEEIEAAVGETITLVFDSDRTGELHVHSKPDQYVDFEAGTSTKKITIATPGVIEIEEHSSGAVIALVTVS